MVEKAVKKKEVRAAGRIGLARAPRIRHRVEKNGGACLNPEGGGRKEDRSLKTYGKGRTRLGKGAYRNFAGKGGMCQQERRGKFRSES